MSEQLQGLLEKISNDGIKKAEKERAEILSKAKIEAEKIIADATSKADLIIKKSLADAQNNENRANATIKQAARDIIIMLEEEIQNRIKTCVKNAVSEVMSPDFVAETIKLMAKNFNNIESDKTLSLIFPSQNVKGLSEYVFNSLAKDFKNNPEFLKSSDFKSGFKIGFKGQDVYIDFSDNALSDLICSYIGSKIAEIIKGS